MAKKTRKVEITATPAYAHYLLVHLSKEHPTVQGNIKIKKQK
jgi:hypothetical protein